ANDYSDSIEIEKIDTIEYLKEINIEGRTYKAFEEELFISAYDAAKIENLIKTKNVKYMLSAIAILYKDTQLGIKEHYDKSHLKHKEIMFGNLPAINFNPVLTFIAQEIVNENERIRNKEKTLQILNDYKQFKS